ncbi:tetratricopeptide repeat protein [Patescibacteria group bacterium]|nr:tetratricopeptide repeat protein [Patescibacteria group bacterium]MBU1891123.1 tetratricopeptide repeat protein [Patescibacteria group bacterium]
MIVKFFVLYSISLVFFLLFLYTFIKVTITYFRKNQDRKPLTKQIISCLVFLLLGFFLSTTTPEIGPIEDIWITILSYILYIIFCILLLLSLYTFVKVIITPFRKTKESNIKTLVKQIISCIVFLLVGFYIAHISANLDPRPRARHYFYEGKMSYENGNYQKAVINLERSINLNPKAKEREEAEQLLNQIKQNQSK